MSVSSHMQAVSLFKPVVLAGLHAIVPVFTTGYLDELGNTTEIQLRGAFSTERRRAPNIVVKYRPGEARFNSGQNIIGFDEVTGLYKYGFYMLDGQIRYDLQARNELEREWLIDTITNAFTALVFVDPVTNVPVNNNLVEYLASQGIVAKGFGPIDYPDVVQSDSASPRPEGQVWEATVPVSVDVSLTYYLPGVSAHQATLQNVASAEIDGGVPTDLPWQPMPNHNPLIQLSFP